MTSFFSMVDVIFLDTLWNNLLCKMLLKISKKSGKTKAKTATVQWARLLAFSFWVQNNCLCKSIASSKYHNNSTGNLFAQQIGIFCI